MIKQQAVLLISLLLGVACSKVAINTMTGKNETLEKNEKIFDAMEDVIRNIEGLDPDTLARYLTLHQSLFKTTLGDLAEEITPDGFKIYFERFASIVAEDFPKDTNQAASIIAQLSNAVLKALYINDEDDVKRPGEIASLALSKLNELDGSSPKINLDLINKANKSVKSYTDPSTKSALAKYMIGAATTTPSVKADIVDLLKQILSGVRGDDSELSSLLTSILNDLEKNSSALDLDTESITDIGETLYLELEDKIVDGDLVVANVLSQTGITIGTTSSSESNSYTLALNVAASASNTLIADGTSTTTLKVLALGSGSTPKNGLNVTVSVPTNGGTVDATSKTTAADGTAIFTVTSSTVVGSYAFTVAAGSGSDRVVSSPLSLTYTALPPAAPTGLALVGAAKDTASTKNVSVSGLINSGHSVELFSDEDCTQSLGSPVAIVTTTQSVSFAVSPGSKTMSVYAQQIRNADSVSSSCSTTSASYQYVDVILSLSIKSGASANIINDGSSQTIMVATAVDSDSNPLSGLTLSITPPANGGTLDSGSQVTDSSGEAEFTLTSSTTAGDYDYSVTYDSSFIASPDLTVSFVVAPPSAPTVSSLIGASKDTLAAKGVSVSGLVTSEAHTVQLFSDDNCSTAISNAEAVSTATQTVTTDLSAGSKTVTIYARQTRTSDSQSSDCSSSSASYEFVDIQLSLSVKSGSSAYLLNNGTDTTILEALAVDSDANPIAGLAITLSSSTGISFADASSGTTGAAGKDEFTITSDTTAASHSFILSADSGFVESSALSIVFSPCTTDMMASSPFANWEVGVSTPIGNAADPVLICNADQFNRIADSNTYDGITKATRMTYHYKLLSDVDLDGVTINPIGDFTNKFTGTFDGDGFKISNVTINQPAQSYVGLFGFIYTGAVIKNLVIENASIIGTNHVGVIGSSDASSTWNGATLTNIEVNNLTVSGSSAVGAIGYGKGLTISGFDVTVDSISGTGSAGGLVGQVTSSDVEEVSVTGVAQDYSNIISINYAGASVGASTSAGGVFGQQSSTTLTRAKAVGLSILSNKGYAGGLVGYVSPNSLMARQDILDAYSSVKVDAGIGQAGGISGTLNTSLYGATIENTYALGAVCATSCGSSDALFPVIGSNTALILNNFYNSETVGQSSTLGNGLTTAEMADYGKFVGGTWDDGFNFHANWMMPSEGGPPELQCFNAPASSFSSLSDIFAGGDGSSGNPWLISNLQQYKYFMHYGFFIDSGMADDYFALTDNIDLSGVSVVSIGSFDNKFIGKFDGGSFTISNIDINLPGRDYVGVFGHLARGAEITNVTFDNVSITGDQYVGVIGRAYESGGYGAILTLTNVNFYNLTLVGNNEVGALGGGRSVAATNVNISINAITAVSGAGSFMGNSSASMISGISVTGVGANHSSTISITGGGSFHRNAIGGLLGYMGGGYVEKASVINLTISGQTGGMHDPDFGNYMKSYAGGIVGWYEPGNGAGFKIADTYNDVHIPSAARGGGIVGHLQNQNFSTSITYSIVTGSICSVSCGTSDALVATLDNTANLYFTDLVYDADTVGQSSIRGSGLTTAQLQQDLNVDGVVDGLEGTGFSSVIWELDPTNLSGGYPTLK